MSYSWRRIINQLPIPVGTRSGRPLNTTWLKNAQFASFMQESGFRSQPGGHYDRSQRRWRALKAVSLWATAFFAAWILVESGRALAQF